MAKKAKSKFISTATKNVEGVATALWKFVEDNPELALAIAFEVGAIINEATRPRGDVKKLLKKQLSKGADLIPKIMDSFENKVPPAVKLLAGPVLTALASGSNTASAKKVRRVAKRKTKTRAAR